MDTPHTHTHNEKTSTEPLTEQSKIRKWILRLFYVSYILAITYSAHSIGWMILFYKIKNAAPDSETLLDGLNIFGELITSAGVLLTISLGILFLRWFYQAYKNLQKSGLKTNHSPSMTIWGFFIPIINLWYPSKLMKEMAIKMHENIGKTFDYGNIIVYWYALFILDKTMNRIIKKFPVENLGQVTVFIVILVTAGIIYFISIFMSIKMFKKISKTEQEFFSKNSGNQLSS